MAAYQKGFTKLGTPDSKRPAPATKGLKPPVGSPQSKLEARLQALKKRAK